MKKALGDRGEIKAREFLEESSYVILHTNWRYGHKEVDIIATQESSLIFIEVKTRKRKGTLLPSEIFTKQKQRFYVECAFIYREEYCMDMYSVRFDIICVHTKQNDTMTIEHWRDVIDVRNVMGSRYSSW